MISNSYIGKTCPYCQYAIKQKSEVAYCQACKIPHHRECWEENRGCTTFGCTETTYKTPAYDSVDISLDDPVNQQTAVSGVGSNAFIVVTLAILVLIILVSFWPTSGPLEEASSSPSQQSNQQTDSQAAELKDEKTYYVITESGSNLFIRKSPGSDDKKDSDIITRVPRGTELKLIDNHGNSVRKDGFTWWEIRVEDSGITGWVASEYVSTSKHSTFQVTQQTDEKIYYVITEPGSNLFIRKSPGSEDQKDSDIITRVPRGTELKLIDNHSNSIRRDGFTWWEIRAVRSGITGWVASEYVSTNANDVY